MTRAQSAAPHPRAGGEYRIGRYRVRARLGKGGMGVVYLGRDETLDRDVAIKTLRVEGAPDDESRGRFEIEAKAAARLQHPNIVTVFELGEDRGLPYIAMELLGGQDLENLVRSGEKLTAIERLDIVIQTLRGLDFAHGHQIVHRDIKPSNIRVLDDGGVKILDFGIAKVESASVTRAGMMVGTPYYMSPEHIRGGTLDGRSDVFAVGVILHELFALKRPFTADDPTRILYRIVNEPHPKLPADVAGGSTAELQKILDKALEKDADARFASAASMADALARLRDRFPGAELNAEEAAALNRARKSLTSNPSDGSLRTTIERIALEHPDATEAQRLLRVYRRKPAVPLSAVETASFPELDSVFAKADSPATATIVAGETVNGRAQTILQDSGSAAPPPGNSQSNALLYGAIGVVVLAGGIATLLLLGGAASKGAAPTPAPTIQEIFVPSGEPSAPKPPAGGPPTRPSTSTTTTTAVAGVPASTSARKNIAVEITSQPQGATVRVDRKTAGTTPVKVEMTAGESHAISFSLPGYQAKEVQLSAPIPASVSATLVAEGPPGTLVVESAYPVTVSASGRTLGAEKAGFSTTLPAGSYDVLVESAAMFLKHRETVQIEGGGTATIRSPAAGKIGIRATPDNCKIFINGLFIDYPPILDRVIAAGSHVVTFEWPDGVKSEEKVQVRAGKPAYVMGRKP